MTDDTEHGRCTVPDQHTATTVHCRCDQGSNCTIYPGQGAEGVARYMAEESGAQAALVMQSGSADEVIANLVAQGWVLQAGEEHINGKRIRYLQPPPGWTLA
jgi:hypothetical protein